jgi:hypothetical protein
MCNHPLEVCSERHHFDTPQQVEAERLAALLKEHWERAATMRSADVG